MPQYNEGAMEIIFHVIHFRSVSEEIERGLMLRTAVAADKFDCGNVLQHASTLWLNQTKSKDLMELARLMASSYLLENFKTFGRVTLEKIFCHGGSYLAFAEQDIGLDLSVLLRICCMFLRILRYTSDVTLKFGFRFAGRASEPFPLPNRTDAI
jgi:hypothetical protein